MSQYSDNFSRYFNYNIWANKAIADFLADKEFILDKELVSSFPTIRKTIFHIADAQHIWLSRMKGVSPTDWPSKSMMPEDAIIAMMNTSTAFGDYCAGRDDSFHGARISFSALDGTVFEETNGNIIMHCMNHSTFHRGQLITMFRQGGLEGKMPRTDLIAYLRETQ